MPAEPPGRLLVTRRAIADIVRSATLGSYGVLGLSASLPARLLARLGLAQPGIRVDQRDGVLFVELDLEIGEGLPIAEVARQVDAAVRHAIRSAVGREIGPIAIHVANLRYRSRGALRSDPPPSSSRGAAPPDGGHDRAGPG